MNGSEILIARSKAKSHRGGAEGAEIRGDLVLQKNLRALRASAVCLKPFLSSPAPFRRVGLRPFPFAGRALWAAAGGAGSDFGAGAELALAVGDDLFALGKSVSDHR